MEEFHSIMREHMPDDSEMTRVQELFDTMDQDKSGRIHYLEFLAATIETSAQFREDSMLEVFDRLDSDNSGAISKSNLKELLGKDYAVSTVPPAPSPLSTHRLLLLFATVYVFSLANPRSDRTPVLQPDVVARMINDADLKNNGKIDQDEFLALMRKTEAEALRCSSSAVVAEEKAGEGET